MKLALFFLLLSVSSLSFANECARDVQKLCSHVTPGKGQIAQCLSENESQLSSACAKNMKEFKKKTLTKIPCFMDIAEFCSDVPNEGHKLHYCLLKNESKLSETCSKDFSKKRGNIITKDVCAMDIVNTCYSKVSEGDAAINKCLMVNKNKLSKFCQKALDNKIAEIRKTNPCFDDSNKFCPTQTKFIDIHQCMVKNVAKVTPECKNMIETEVKKDQANPCYMDLRKHCVAGLGSNEQHQCLTLNEEHLSLACKKFRQDEDVKLKKMVEVCEKDRLKICPKAPFQNGMVLKCLKENSTKISKECKSLL